MFFQFSKFLIGSSIYSSECKDSHPPLGASIATSWKDWICVFSIILGIILFLYGANYYDPTVGWTGVFFFVGGIVVIVLLYVYNTLNKKEEKDEKEVSEPTQNA